MENHIFYAFIVKNQDTLLVGGYAMQKSNVPNNVWVPSRPLKTNPQGPKMVWVPKVK